MDNQKIATELVDMAERLAGKPGEEKSYKQEYDDKVDEFEDDIKSLGEDFSNAINKVKNPLEDGTIEKLYKKYKSGVDIDVTIDELQRAIADQVADALQDWGLDVDIR